MEKVAASLNPWVPPMHRPSSGPSAIANCPFVLPIAHSQSSKCPPIPYYPLITHHCQSQSDSIVFAQLSLSVGSDSTMQFPRLTVYAEWTGSRGVADRAVRHG